MLAARKKSKPPDWPQNSYLVFCPWTCAFVCYKPSNHMIRASLVYVRYRVLVEAAQADARDAG